MNYRQCLLHLCLLFVLSSLLFSCGSSPEVAVTTTDEFVLKDGFEIELVAGEPLLHSPVAMTFDENGRIWVVELPGYMRDINGTKEDFPDGKIVILEDTDGDGKMDDRKIFLDSLKTPRAFALAYGGLLYSETPKLWWVPIEGDKPGKRELVDSLYVIGGNIEHQPNGLLFNIDNWFYSAKSNARYRRVDGVWKKEPTTFRGQWGISHDELGRLYYNSNSNPLQCDMMMPNTLLENEFLKTRAGTRVTLDQERKLYPIQPTSVNRGYSPGVLDSLTGKVATFTSACGPLVYLGNQFPSEFRGNAFVCGPEANLVKRYILKDQNGVVEAMQAYGDSEFLVSRDESFRPVSLYTGLDGALYIVDLRKGVIQHRAYMSSYLRDEINAKRLDTITGIGRIYRVLSRKEDRLVAPDFADLTIDGLVDLLQHENGQVRVKAQQLLVFRENQDAIDRISAIARDASNPLGQIHALWTLEGLNSISLPLLLDVSSVSKETNVLSHILTLSAPYAGDGEVWPLIEQALAMQAPETDLALCHLIGNVSTEEGKVTFVKLGQKYRSNRLFSEALVSGVSGREESILASLPKGEVGALDSILMETIKNKTTNNSLLPTFSGKEFLDSRTKGAKLFNTFCSACHGVDGKGVDQLAPPLHHSEFVMESAEKLILIALNGMQGPITVDGEAYNLNLVMPGVKNNPELSDEDLALILKYIGNAFNVGSPSVKVEKIKELRKLTEDREELFTVESLDAWLREYQQSTSESD